MNFDLYVSQFPIKGGKFIEDYPYYKGSSTYHGGRDISAAIGTEVVAAFSGTIVESRKHWSYGVNVVVETEINGKTYRTIYAHLQEENQIQWDIGDKVNAGDVIGYVGMTGNTTGPHLHFEMREYPYIQVDNNVDPQEYIGRVYG